MDLANFVIEALKRFDAPVVLIGESFGGLLACFVASRAKALVSGLVLINPGTSYERSIWPSIFPLVTGSGPAFPVVGFAALFATVPQPEQFRRIFFQVANQVNSAPNPLEEMNGLLNKYLKFLELVPPATVEWRLTRWLMNGNKLMESRYKDITTPTLLLIGTKDRLLPSASESYRLEKALSSASMEIVEYQEGGHALLDGTLDMNKVFQESRTLGPPPVPLPIDAPILSQKEIDDADRLFLKNIRSTFSPVFLSRDAQGNIVRGIENVPVGSSGRPVLLVGNHQLYGLDTPLIIREFLQERKTLVRGLAHPLLFLDALNARKEGDGEQQEDSFPFSKKNLLRFGAVEVSPGSIFQLLQRNETILLFPGGANEACHLKDEAYMLKWSKQTDFVRMAAMFDALIVPFGAIGVADSFNMLLDVNDISEIPILGRSFSRYPSKHTVFTNHGLSTVSSDFVS